MKELRDLDCKNKKIIVRVDLNVPVFEGTITDHSRIHAILPTLEKLIKNKNKVFLICLLYTSPSPRDKRQSRMPSSA